MHRFCTRDAFVAQTRRLAGLRPLVGGFTLTAVAGGLESQVGWTAHALPTPPGPDPSSSVVSYPWKRVRGPFPRALASRSVFRGGFVPAEACFRGGCVPAEAWLWKPPRGYFRGLFACVRTRWSLRHTHEKVRLRRRLALAGGGALPPFGWVGGFVHDCSLSDGAGCGSVNCPVLGGWAGTGERSQPAAGAGAVHSTLERS